MSFIVVSVMIVLIIIRVIEMYYQLNKRNISYLYSFAAVVFSCYGIFVCPFIESLPRGTIFIEVSAAFIFMLISRLVIVPRFYCLSKQAPLLIDLSIFLLFGFGISLFMGQAHDFPIESNLKVVFGMGILGIFTGIITTQVELIERYKNMPQHYVLNTELHGNRRSITQQFTVLVTLLVVALTTTLIMVAVKDLFLLESAKNHYLNGEGKIKIIKEFIFVSFILLLYTFLVVFLWGKKLSLILNMKENALNNVAKGVISERLPVYSNDEFGVLAVLTNKMLFSLEESQTEIQQTRDSAIVGLSALAESRDNETGAHILRTQEYIRVLAFDLRNKVEYSDVLTDNYINLLFKSAPLHDVGKVGIPDDILLKPGKLTEEEFEIMKGHAAIGAKALSVAEAQMQGESSFLQLAKEIALTHHEKWNGSGYPQQLKGKDIPLSGRLMALADVYDALISKRVYKLGFSHEKAKEIILEGKGSHFDPMIVDSFLNVETQFQKIAKKYQDN